MCPKTTRITWTSKGESLPCQGLGWAIANPSFVGCAGFEVGCAGFEVALNSRKPLGNPGGVWQSATVQEMPRVLEIGSTADRNRQGTHSDTVLGWDLPLESGDPSSLGAPVVRREAPRSVCRRPIGVAVANRRVPERVPRLSPSQDAVAVPSRL